MKRSDLLLRWVMSAGGLALLWWIVTEGNMRQWWFGAAVIAGILVVSRRLSPVEASKPVRFAPLPLIRFVGLFLWQSMLGGLGAARAALRPSRGVKPYYTTYHLAIGAEHSIARTSFVASICLLPGTLSCELNDETLVLHVLDEGLYKESALRTYEQALAAVFSIDLRR